MMTCRGLIYGMVHTTMYKKTSSVGNTRSLSPSMCCMRIGFAFDRRVKVGQPPHQILPASSRPDHGAHSIHCRSKCKLN
jgi:hypothetical protein